MGHGNQIPLTGWLFAVLQERNPVGPVIATEAVDVLNRCSSLPGSGTRAGQWRPRPDRLGHGAPRLPR